MANIKVLEIAADLIKRGAKVKSIKRYRKEYRVISLNTGYHSGNYVMLSIDDYNKVLDLIK